MGGVGESKRYYWLITVKPFLSKRYRLGSQFCFKYKFSEKQNVYLVDTCKGPVGAFFKKGVEAFATYVKCSQICLLEFL